MRGNNERTNRKYTTGVLLYVCKSTDVEDKQVLSVETQIIELRKYATDNNMRSGFCSARRKKKPPEWAAISRKVR